MIPPRPTLPNPSQGIKTGKPAKPPKPFTWPRVRIPRPVDREDVLWLGRILFYAVLVIFAAGVLGVALRVFLVLANFR